MKLRTWIIIAALFGLFFWKGFLVTFGVAIGAVGIWTLWCVCWDSHREKRGTSPPCTPITGKGGLLTPEPTAVHRVESGTGPHNYNAPRSTVDHGLLRVGGPAKCVEKVPEEPWRADHPNASKPPEPCSPPPAAVAEVEKPKQVEPCKAEVTFSPKETRKLLRQVFRKHPRKRGKVVKRRKGKKPNVSVAITRKPGQKCPQSGQWTCRYKFRGKWKRMQTTSVKDEPMPPCPRGRYWKLTDRTRHAKK